MIQQLTAPSSGIRPIDGANQYQIIIDDNPVGDPITGAAEAIREFRRLRGLPQYPDGVESGLIPGTRAAGLILK